LSTLFIQNLISTKNISKSCILCWSFMYIRTIVLHNVSMPNYSQVNTSEDRESTRNFDSDACLCLAFGLGLFIFFCIAVAYIFSPSQAMIDARHRRIDDQLIDYCSNRCCYSRYRNTYNRQYGLYSSQKVLRIQAGVGCIYCPDRRYLDYHYDCNFLSTRL